MIPLLTTKYFLAKLSWFFMAIRGQFPNVYSDNSSNFIGASCILKTYLAQVINLRCGTIFGLLKRLNVVYSLYCFMRVMGKCPEISENVKYPSNHKILAKVQ
jgi:hypothetical protein